MNRKLLNLLPLYILATEGIYSNHPQLKRWKYTPPPPMGTRSPEERAKKKAARKKTVKRRKRRGY